MFFIPIHLFRPSLAIPVAILAIQNEEDREFVTRIYLEYRALMYKTAYKYCSHNKHDTEDAVSEAIVRICKYPQALRRVPETELPAYLVTVVSNVCRAENRKKHPLNFQYDDQLDTLAETAQDPYESIFDHADAVSLLQSFNTLSERDKELIRMRHIDQMSYDEMAKQLHMKSGALRTALSRAKQRMRQSIRKGGTV